MILFEWNQPVAGLMLVRQRAGSFGIELNQEEPATIVENGNVGIVLLKETSILYHYEHFVFSYLLLSPRHARVPTVDANGRSNSKGAVPDEPEVAREIRDHEGES